MIVDFKKKQREHPPIHIDRTAVEKVESYKFLGVHITDKLKCSNYTDSIVKKAQQRLFNLRRLKKFIPFSFRVQADLLQNAPLPLPVLRLLSMVQSGDQSDPGARSV